MAICGLNGGSSSLLAHQNCDREMQYLADTPTTSFTSKRVLLINCHSSKTTSPTLLHLEIFISMPTNSYKIRAQNALLLDNEPQGSMLWIYVCLKKGICPAAAAFSEDLSYKFLLWGVLVSSFYIFKGY